MLETLGAQFIKSSQRITHSEIASQAQQRSDKTSTTTDTREAGVVITLSSEAQSFLAQSQGTPAARPSSEELFARTDSNADGLVSEEEFITARPESVSEEQAAARFAVIDSEGDGLVTQEEIEAAGAPPSATSAQSSEESGTRPPPPPPGGGGGASLEEIFDELDTNEDGVVDINELMAGLEEAAEDTEAEGGAAESSIQQSFVEAIRAYSSLDIAESNSELFI